MLKVLIISSNVFPIPLSGYGGMEMLCWWLSEGLARKGHSITVVCPEGSRFTQDSIEAIFTAPREPEEQSYLRYRGRLESGEFPVVIDATWERWASVSNVGRDPQIPIIGWFHSHPSVYQSQPPVRWPLWVGVSRSHAENLQRAWQMPVKFVYNGIDLDFYKNTGKPRGDRYLWLARWTPEKGPAEIIDLAQKLRIPVDMYGDTEIIGGNAPYCQACLSRADGMFARASGGISREATVEAYSTHKALLFWPNWEEMFGLTIAESMACACPPIVGRRGAMPELIQDGKTGFLVDTLDQMAELIKRDAVKELKPEVMRKWVERKFSLERFVQDWDKLIQEVASGARW